MIQSNRDELRGTAESQQERTRGTEVSIKRQSPQGEEGEWEQEGCYRINNNSGETEMVDRNESGEKQILSRKYWKKRKRDWRIEINKEI